MGRSPDLCLGPNDASVRLLPEPWQVCLAEEEVPTREVLFESSAVRANTKHNKVLFRRACIHEQRVCICPLQANTLTRMIRE